MLAASFAESGCDFQFTSRFGKVTCGNAVVRASSAQLVVRYDAFNTGCRRLLTSAAPMYAVRTAAGRSGTPGRRVSVGTGELAVEREL